MKKYAVLCLTVLLCAAFLCACGGGDTAGDTPISLDMAALCDELLAEDFFTDLLSPVEPGIAAMLYSVDEADIAECVANFSTGATAEEITIFKAVDAEAAARLAEAAEARVETQMTAYKDYAPGEVTKLENAIVQTAGDYVIYIVSADADAAQSIVDKYVG